MKIEIFGDGCSACDELKKQTEQAIRELGLDVPVTVVTDPRHESELHAVSLPQLVVNGHHHASKTSMTVQEIREYLEIFEGS